VAAGITISASTVPAMGIRLISDTKAMNMKNRPVMASGWRTNTRMPSLTQVAP
jgi:hypothetical protein